MTVTSSDDTPLWQPPPGHEHRPPPTSPPPTSPPVEPVRTGGSRLRWIVALLATVLVVAVLAGVFLLANRPAPAGALSPLAAYAPADAAAYVELRLDLPGDQRERVISFMSHFPGFADPATFDLKVSDTIEQLLRNVSDEVSWKRDIEPWFGGQIVLIATTLERAEGTPDAGVFAMSVKDRALLEQFIAAQGLLEGLERSDYRGQALWSARLEGERVTLAVTDAALLVSKRVEDIHVALDVAAGVRPGLGSDDQLQAQLGNFHPDRLATFYFNGASLADELGGGLGSGSLGLMTSGFGSPLTGRIVGELRAEGDHLLVHYRMRAAEGEALPTVPPNRRTSLAERFPADSVAYVEMREIGQAVRQMVSQMLELVSAGSPGSVPEMEAQFEQFLGTRPEDFLDFLGDGAFSFSYSGGRASGGFIAELSDEDVARQRLERLVTALRLATATGAVPVTVTEEQHGDATVTVFGLEGLGIPELPISSVSYAVSDGQLLLGVDDFVTDALDRAAEQSLASSTRFSAALAEAGATNSGTVFVDIAALRALLEQPMPAAEREFYDREIKPYVEPFAYVVMAAFSEGDELVGRVLLYVE